MDKRGKQKLKIKVVLIITFLISNQLSLHAQSINFRYFKSDIDYESSFSDRIYQQVEKDDSVYNLKPMLNVGICVPNGGIYKSFSRLYWDTQCTTKFFNIFRESPYTKQSPLLYYRFGWYKLEKEKNKYQFDVIIDSLLLRAIKNHSRVIIGIASMCGESSNMSQTYKGRNMAIPKYLYEELANSNNPLYEDNTYGKGYTVNYDSPILFKRYNKLLKKFSKWLNGNVKGTNIKRRDLIYAIEMRYMGYWGEGSVKSDFYPKTNLIDKYVDSYLKHFPDILLIAGGQETLHLPTYDYYKGNKDNVQSNIAMKHVYKLLTSRNEIGRIGMFIDSWHKYSDQYDLNSRRIIMDEKGNIIPLANFLKENVWGNIYLTGELGYLTTLSPKGDLPFSGLYQQFSTRNVSGISIHNFTISDSKNKIKVTNESYIKVKQNLSMIGYRLVLNSFKIDKVNNKLNISFYLKNIGVSKIFHDYYRIHLFIKDDNNNIIYDYISKFDFRSIEPNTNEPLLYTEGGSAVQESIPFNKGKLYLRIEDEKQIEHPMCLSNYGRLKDGSYFLTEIK